MKLTETVFAVIDTETTGIEPAENRVVELACARVQMGYGVLDHWSTLVNPGRSIPPEASAVHHLVDEDVAGAPVLDEVLPRFWGQEFHAIAAHNAKFDTAYILPNGHPVLCTHRLARKLWPDLDQAGNQYLRYHLKLDVPEAKGMAAHRAEVDALVTAKLLLYELEEMLRRSKNPGEATVEGLIAWVVLADDNYK